jgi:hypothetical protein
MGKFWRILPWALLLITLGWAGYAMLDQGVTITYHEDEMGHLKKQRGFLRLVAQSNLMGKTKSEAVKFLNANKIEYFEKGQALVAEETSLEFNNGKLVRLEID